MRLIFVSSQLFDSASFCDGKPTNKALIPFNVVDVQVDLLLKNNQLFLHLNFQIVTCSLNLRLHLNHLLSLVIKELISLVLSVLLLKSIHSFCLFDFESLELLSVVHRFIDSLIDSHQFFIVLHHF